MFICWCASDSSSGYIGTVLSKQEERQTLFRGVRLPWFLGFI